MKVCLFGASGWTGRLVLQAVGHLPLQIVLAGRDKAKLEQIAKSTTLPTSIRVADVSNASTVRAALAGVDVVVNCAGPYVELGPPVLDAALAEGCHYFDVSGENSYLRTVYDLYDAPARARGLTFCPAFAAKGALGDWSAATAARRLRSKVDDVAIAYAHGLREYFRPSAGSVLSAAGQHFFKQRDDHDPRQPVARRFHFPPPFGTGFALLVPGPEEISIRRNLPEATVRSFVSLAPGNAINEPWARWLSAWLPWIPMISESLRSQGAALGTLFATPRMASEEDTFVAAIEVRAGQEMVYMGIATRDAYLVTGQVVSIGLERLLRGGLPSGVVPPASLCDGSETLAELTRRGIIRFSQCHPR